MAVTDPEKQPLIPFSTPTLEDGEQEPQPTLAELRQRVIDAQREYQVALNRTPAGRWSIRFAVMAVAFCFSLMLFMLLSIGTEFMDDEYSDPRVPLDVHIMSKCPDARDCLHDMILPAMVNVSHLVKFNLDFIGKETEHDPKTNQTEIVCMHGPTECLGNILELCSASLYPNPKIHLGFTMCLSHDYPDIPARELIEDCALEHGIDIAKLNACAIEDDGRRGQELLRQSVERSHDLGVERSCTVRLAGETRCVRDGGEWKDCESGSKASDLVRDVRRLYGGDRD
ncbi:hypothetical protein K431DRAFT_229434 [Polychaeton citri CBS 116435]|uniref:Gamma interferon inducible lysosomal thiol reductase n=1 Tax=Polychaeton citri CBS 116435 TaxID=1314669 RepID=A0A9P4UNK6_9PEZI|nr:hypothetical protein K431DRAFT_229434 [Polychaeton citri CBS 116435]